jgi:protein involved in polysaccharide export with SLBB domain
MFYDHPDHNMSEVLVRPDGKILLPLVGEMPAAGLTGPELSDQIAKRYSTNLRDPKVAVSIKSVTQNRVYVGGEVLRAGFVQYRPGLTAVQALVDAGGPKDTAQLKEVVLLQKMSETEYRPSRVDLAKVLEEGDTKADILLGPSDLLFVPKTGIAKANVWVEQHIIRMLPIRLDAFLR